MNKHRDMVVRLRTSITFYCDGWHCFAPAESTATVIGFGKDDSLGALLGTLGTGTSKNEVCVLLTVFADDEKSHTTLLTARVHIAPSELVFDRFTDFIAPRKDDFG